MHALQRASRPELNDSLDDQRAALRVQHALLELRAGRDIQITAVATSTSGDQRGLTVAALEAMDPATLESGCAAGFPLELLLSSQRASVLGHEGSSEAVVVRLTRHLPASSESGHGRIARRVAGLDGPGDPPSGSDTGVLTDRTDAAAVAALELTRQARLQPALVIRHASVSPALPERLSLSAEDIMAYRRLRGQLIERTGSAQIALAGVPDSTFHAYRERFGDAEHAAIIVGEPDLAGPVTVRLHSACFTGDLFGSLRCDCGEQLQGAVTQLLAGDGGVILYLDQEGRGIGLGNKLRAYTLQAAGMDTIEADRHLGFGADGRDFTAARAMLGDLGIQRVRLLTNNPAKVAALNGDGLQVIERLPLYGTINPHNERYLATKRDRGGHLPSILAGAQRRP